MKVKNLGDGRTWGEVKGMRTMLMFSSNNVESKDSVCGLQNTKCLNLFGEAEVMRRGNTDANT